MKKKWFKESKEMRVLELHNEGELVYVKVSYDISKDIDRLSRSEIEFDKYEIGESYDPAKFPDKRQCYYEASKLVATKKPKYNSSDRFYKGMADSMPSLSSNVLRDLNQDELLDMFENQK